MAVPQIDPFSPAPNRQTDSREQFTIKADARMAEENRFTGQANELAVFVDQRAIDATQSAAEAADSAEAAAVSAAAAASVETDVSEQIARAEAAATNAENSAAAAESAPGSIGNLALLQATALSF